MRSTYSICKGALNDILRHVPLPPDWVLLALLARLIILGWILD